MKYQWLLFDLDDTLLDFKGNEKKMLEAALKMNGITLTDDAYEVYKMVNHELWQKMEKGVYKKDEILTLRFEILFFQMHLMGDAAQVNHDYLVSMGDYITFEPHAISLLDSLKGKVKMAIITNGAKLAQESKMRNAKLAEYFEGVFISDVIGHNKPEERFFEHVLNELGIADLSSALIIGDGLTSDILGGNMAGLDTCWYNPNGNNNETQARPSYEIRNLKEIKEIIGL